MKSDLFTNAVVIPTTLGGREHGHIGLVMKYQLYHILSSKAFIIPNNSGPLPVFNPNMTCTAAHQDAIIREHKEQRRLYDTTTNVDLALKKQLIEVYLAENKNGFTGFLHATTRDLFDNLMQRYGKITPLAIENNKTRMEDPLDTSQPIEVHFQCIDDCLQFAADTESPFSAQQTLETVYYAVSASELYSDGCKAWRKRNDNTKTWVAFKKYFAAKYHDLREQKDMNTMQLRYHSVNAAVVDQAPKQSRLMEALDNLALATSNNRNIIADSTATNQQLVSHMVEAVNALKVLIENDIKREKERCQRVKTYNEKFDPNGYCWSHG